MPEVTLLSSAAFVAARAAVLGDVGRSLRLGADPRAALLSILVALVAAFPTILEIIVEIKTIAKAAVLLVPAARRRAPDLIVRSAATIRQKQEMEGQDEKRSAAREPRSCQ
jgi:hypothetical protein